MAWVSILVFLEYEFRLLYSLCAQSFISPVSILVFLEYEFRHMISSSIIVASLVSILVFLEYEFRLALAACKMMNQMSFNPCFPGIWIQACILFFYTTVWIEFQSLFSWNMNSGAGKYRRRTSRFNVSILVFLEYEFRLLPLEKSGGFFICFNPCFPGIWIQARIFQEETGSIV